MATLDHELKFSRALKHLQDLDGEIRRWLDGHHYTVRYEFDLQARFGGLNKPDPASRFSMFSGTVSFDGKSIPTPPGVEFGHGLLTAFATAEQPPRDPISLCLIGDTLHNLRSGLDNLAHALALAGPGPLSKEFPGSSEFPIFGDENRKGVAGSGPGLFQNNGLFKIQGWHPDAKAAVELLQPYHRGNDYRSDPLWTLHELDNISKHRLLHPAVAAFESTRWRPSGFTNVLVGPGIMEFPRGAISGRHTNSSGLWRPSHPSSSGDARGDTSRPRRSVHRLGPIRTRKTSSRDPREHLHPRDREGQFRNSSGICEPCVCLPCFRQGYLP